jgi:4-diphosphocytidyl-2C-methyl-D-erythritol kinase
MIRLNAISILSIIITLISLYVVIKVTIRSLISMSFKISVDYNFFTMIHCTMAYEIGSILKDGPIHRKVVVIAGICSFTTAAYIASKHLVYQAKHNVPALLNAIKKVAACTFLFVDDYLRSHFGYY